MKTEQPEEGMLVVTKESGGQVVNRKGKVWTKDKVNQLINLYKQHECLWNYYIESYRNKAKRTKAIESICNILEISKFDFGRKIHNLRNQYNSEMKKLEKRIEVAGGNSNNLIELKCKWEHFESLHFLKQVIEPRPGWSNSFIVSTPPPNHKKMRIKYDFNSEEEGEHYIAKIDTCGSNTVEGEEVAELFEEATADDESIDNYEEIVEDNPLCSKNEECSGKVQELSITFPISTKPPKTYLSRSSASSVNQRNTSTNYHIQQKDEQNHQLYNTTVIDIPASTTTHSSPSTSEVPPQNRPRDNWDAFGELVASEIRILKHESSRKKLKRKILQAMLDVGEDDDNIS